MRCATTLTILMSTNMEQLVLNISGTGTRKQRYAELLVFVTFRDCIFADIW